jgi:acetyl-CoA carboxylase biotin carboxylase subunit
MERALSELIIVGVSTNQGLHRRLLADSEFRRAEFDIQFLERRPDLLAPAADEARDVRIAVAAALAEDERSRGSQAFGDGRQR